MRTKATERPQAERGQPVFSPGKERIHALWERCHRERDKAPQLWTEDINPLEQTFIAGVEEAEDRLLACAISEPRSWDTEILGHKIHHLTHLLSDAESVQRHVLLRKASLRALSEVWSKEDVRRVTARVNVLDIPSTLALSGAGFAPLSPLMELACPVPASQDMPSQIHEANASDERAVARIAGTSFQYDRFHMDPSLSAQQADSIHRAWALHSLSGRAKVMLVYRERDETLGFCSLLLNNPQETARIDLLAVEAHYAGQGVGSRLIQGALAFLVGKASSLIAATQTSNIPALRLYLRTGFFPKASFFDFRWISDVLWRVS